MNNITISFLGAPLKSIENDIQKLFENSDKVSISVAYVKKSGVDFIANYLSNNKNSSPPIISVITGFDFSITDADALNELMEMEVQCHVVQDNNFHPKIYIFEKDDDVTVIVGSSNLSGGGLSSNYEANVLIKGKASDGPIKETLQYFAYIKSNSTLLDEHAVDLYKKCKNKSDEMMSEIIDDEEVKISKNELKEYLNRVDEDEELTEHDKHLLTKIEDMILKADSYYNIGSMDESIGLLQKAYGMVNQLESINSESAVNNRFECVLSLSYAFEIVGKKEEACGYAIEAENIAKRIYKKSEHKDFLPLLKNLRKSISQQKELEKKNKLCNIFIGLHKKHENEIAEYSSLALSLGEVYAISSNLMYELGDKDTALIHILKSLKYLDENLQMAEDFYSEMIANLYLGRAYEIKVNIDIKNEKDETTMIKCYEKAISIAKDELGSKFWEGTIRMDFGTCNKTHRRQACTNLKVAKEIFESLEYPELIQEIQPFLEILECPKSTSD